MSLSAIMGAYELMRERLHPYLQYGRGRFMETTPSVATAPERGLDPGLHGLLISRTPAWQFSAAERVVCALKAVVIRITRGEALYFAENSNLDIVATGETVLDAIDEFSQLLVDFYLHYRELSWDDAIGDARRLKELYGNLFVEGSVEG